MTLLLRGQTRLCLCFGTSIQYCTVPYLQVPTMLCPSHSLLLVYADKYLYVGYLNKMIYGNNYMKTKVISFDAKANLSSVL